MLTSYPDRYMDTWMNRRNLESTDKSMDMPDFILITLIRSVWDKHLLQSLNAYICNNLFQIVVYCDLHGHSRKQNVFMYGCNVGEQRNMGTMTTEIFLKERLFPWLMSQKVCSISNICLICK